MLGRKPAVNSSKCNSVLNVLIAIYRFCQFDRILGKDIQQNIIEIEGKIKNK